MEIKILPVDYSREKFNEAAIHPLQSWEWGEARIDQKTDIIRFGEFDGEKLINVYQMSLHPIPKTSYKIGYIPRSVIPTEGIISFLKSYSQSHKIVFVKFEPYVFVATDDKKKMPDGLMKSPHPLFTSWTQVLDMNKSEAELSKNMKSKTRYNVGLAERKGVTVREDNTDKGFETFIKLYFETCKRQHYFGHTVAYHRAVWDHLKKSASHILIAEYEGIPLAAYELFLFKNHWYYVYGGTSDLHRNLMASNLLMWKTIQLGKKLGATEFDMWGSLAPGFDQGHSWAGFTRFKEGYGTEYKQTVGSYDLVINPLLYNLYNVAQKVRTKLLERLPV